MPALDIQVAVIGAGTFGISVALALHRRGIDVRTYGKPYSLWLDHTLPNFALRSDALASGIHSEDETLSLATWLRRTLAPAARRRWMMRRIPGPMFRRYLRWTLTELPFAPVAQRVTRLRREGGGFRVQTDGGEDILASQVVLATGIENHRYVPAALRGLGERVVHSWDAAGLQTISDRRVLVVGSGQSAGEACALLEPTNRVTWLHRAPLHFFAEPIGLPRMAYRGAVEAAARMRHLPAGWRARIGRPFTQPSIMPDLRRPLARLDLRREQADVGTVGLEAVNGSVRSRVLEEAYDRIVACTGFRAGLDSLPFLDEGLRSALRTDEHGVQLDRHYQSSVPGLYAVGTLAEGAHGAAQRFMIGAFDATRRVAGSIGR